MHAHTICVEIQMWHVILPMATTGEEVYSLLNLQPNRWAPQKHIFQIIRLAAHCNKNNIYIKIYSYNTQQKRNG